MKQNISVNYIFKYIEKLTVVGVYNLIYLIARK